MDDSKAGTEAEDSDRITLKKTFDLIYISTTMIIIVITIMTTLISGEINDQTKRIEGLIRNQTGIIEVGQIKNRCQHCND